MTTKNLSRELCEICGIEAKQFTKDFKTREKAASFGRKITGIPKFRGNKFDIGSYTDNQSIYQVRWKEFPDFTQPENFVKLLEIVSKKASISFCHNGSYFGCSIHYSFKDIFEADMGTIQHNFLNTLLKQDLRNPCRPTLLECIKEAIKSEDWKYE